MLSQYGNTYYGLKTDTKPSGTALNGREFKEMDTGKKYVYDAENDQWIEQPSEGGGGGGTEEEVTGTDPVITGAANTFYVCGEVDTLSITPPNSGIIDVFFISGSTPAVLTIPATVIMPDWWLGVEANRAYEINIKDGVYATVTSWGIS